MDKNTIGQMKRGYILYSASTRMPYVQYEKAGRCDQIFLFALKEEAEEAARLINQDGFMVGVAPLEGKEIKEHLMRAPFLGVDALFFKGANEGGGSYRLSDVLPDQVKEHIVHDRAHLQDVVLTGIYYAQYLGKTKDVNPDMLANYARAFGASLVRAEFFIPVIPKDADADAENLNLKNCQLPLRTLKKKDTNEEFAFVTLFTSMEEVTAYCKESLAKVRVLRVPFKDILFYMEDSMTGIVVDPMSLNLPLRKTDMEMLIGDK